MPYTIKPGSFKYKKSNGQFSEIDCFEGPDLTEEVVALEKGKAPIIIDSATGNPIVIKDGADGLPVEGMKIHFSPVQSGTGDPSPSNVRPISGWSGVTAWRTGVNVWDEEWEVGAYNTSTGAKTGTSAGRIRSAGFIPVIPGSNYKVVGNVDGVCYYDKSKNYLSYSINNSVITIPDDCYFITFYSKTNYGSIYNHDISINYPSTDTEYHPYTGQSYPITFPDGQTIYGGTLDAVTGVLTVDTVLFAFKDLVALNGASANWMYNSAYNFFETQNAIISTGTANTETGIVCSCYQSRPYGYNSSYSSENSIVWAHTSGTLRIKDNRYTDVDVWKTAIADEQIVIPIATPYEIQLDPITVQTLLGDNIIWSDANGDIELDYRADTKLFVDKNNPVIDIRVKGASLVQNGIVNMPLAQASTPGLMMVGAGYGLKAADINGNSAGRIQTDQAWPDLIKGFADQYRPITPKYLPDAVFQGLARAAGDTTQAASSNAVGTFTSDAIVAIQKMLGVYQAPWELIREDTVTNAEEADIEITVDGNGISLALTDLVLQLTIPAESNTIISSYGLIHLFYYTGQDTYVQVMLNNFSGPKQHAWFGSVYANCVNGFMQSSCSQYSESGNNRPVMIRNSYDFFPASSSAIIKILIKNVQGTIEYKLYGRRKWTT